MKKILLISMPLALLFSVTAFAQTPMTLGLDIGVTDNPQSVVSTLQIILLLASIAFIPTLLLMMTCFTRTIIVLHFLRSALGTQQMPPNQILIGLALILTFFVMGKPIGTINETALIPYASGAIGQEEAIKNAMEPLREFMFVQVEDKDMALFAELAGETYASIEEIPNRVLIPAFVLGELTKGFSLGFYIYLPFIVIDMVVASVLMAMGMMMLPPAMISLPFKIMLFTLIGGWNFVIESLIKTYFR